MNQMNDVLYQSMVSTLETYSNVHRGSGHHSLVTTHLYEMARGIVLDYLGLRKRDYAVIFCSPRRAVMIVSSLRPRCHQQVSSREIGLPIGIVALAVKRRRLPREIPFVTGGGTARLVATDWAIQAGVPERFEAGTPAIVNIVAFARTLQLMKENGIKDVRCFPSEERAVSDILHHDELDPYTGKELLDKLRNTLIGRDLPVPTAEGMQSFINLDNGASTPTFSPVFQAFWKALHVPVPIRTEVIRAVRSRCAEFLQAPLSDYDILFTSNTTESINLVAENLSRESMTGIKPVVVNSLLEHNSNDLPWRIIPGGTILRVSIDKKGFIDLNELEELLIAYNQDVRYRERRIRLVAVSGASNVLGTYNNLPEISRIVHAYGAWLMVDAAQLVAHRKVDMKSWGIDCLVFSAHKAYAPFGTGVLVVRKDFFVFSDEELDTIRSSGEENAAGIAALGKSLQLLQRIGMDRIREEEQALTAKALVKLSGIPGLQIHGIPYSENGDFIHRGGVISFFMKGILSARVARELAERSGIGVRYGCHCAHILVKHVLHVGPSLERFQYLIVSLFPKLNLPGVTRVSIGIENTEEDIDTFIRAMDEILLKSDYPGKEVRTRMQLFVKEAEAKVYGKN